MVSVKICGLTSPESVQAVIAARADYAGFVYFPKSPRHIEFEHAATLKALLPASIPAVSVLVDPDDALLAQMHAILKPDYVQLHGDESPKRLREIHARFPSLKLIKALKIRSSDDVAKAGLYYDSCDMLMFDAKPPQGMLPGGNGLSFDWALLKGRDFPLPWILSGGLSCDNVADAILQTDAKMVDVSSGVERAPGLKDVGLVDKFVKSAR